MLKERDSVSTKIAEAFSDVDFSSYPQVEEAAAELKGVCPKEVLDWIANKIQDEWHWDELINIGGGVQNVEKAFGAEFDIAALVNAYFVDDDHWYFGGSESQWLDEFNELTGKEITVDDITENIDVDFLLSGPGLCVFFDFIEANGGDFRMAINRLAPVVDKFSDSDVEDIIYCLDEYLEESDFDMEKLFSKIEWTTLYTEEVQDYVEFFKKHAPELTKKIPVPISR